MLLLLNLKYTKKETGLQKNCTLNKKVNQFISGFRVYACVPEANIKVNYMETFIPAPRRSLHTKQRRDYSDAYNILVPLFNTPRYLEGRGQ